MPLQSLPFQLQVRDLSILRGLLESRIMTSAHMADLYFEGKREATKKRLQKLKAAGLIGERRRQVSEPTILYLATKAFRLLKEEGILAEYPSFDTEKRSRVSDLTIRHELEVMDVKAAFHSGIRASSNFEIKEFLTWPLLYEFDAAHPSFGREINVKPDGFIRVHENEPDGGLSEHAFFLEVDRSTETIDTLANRAACYLEYFKAGGFAERNGGERSQFKDYPFRVLMVFKTEERRNNFAERLLQMNPPIFTLAYLTTRAEVTANPLGTIWLRPKEYRDATTGTAFDPAKERKTWGYKRQSEREIVVDGKARKISLFAE